MSILKDSRASQGRQRSLPFPQERIETSLRIPLAPQLQVRNPNLFQGGEASIALED
jgi:hypothetical protein